MGLTLRSSAAVAVLNILLLGGCAALPPPAPASSLDEHTGITLTVVDEPLVLARDRRDVAANAREYLTLAAATRNQSGRITAVLLVHRWSTIDERVLPVTTPPPASLVIVADGRDLHLVPLQPLPREFSERSARLWHPQVDRVSTDAYRIDAAALGYLAGSSRISASYDAPGEGLPYLLWRDGRAALQRFSAEALPQK
ncbi:MAG: hypothetical protein U1F11_13485 [Steroidobacteraceae bacterium]